MTQYPYSCGNASHFSRRTLVSATGLAGATWLTPLSRVLAQQADIKSQPRAKSVIVLWLQGGPSQLDTFDPKPGTLGGGDTKAIMTSVPGIQLAEGFEPLAELMDDVSIVRSVVSKEGDHERATYNVKTGFRPDPTLVHPALGAVLCHQLPDDLEIPRHVSIYPGAWPARGGYLGDQFDAFKINDPKGRIPDVRTGIKDERLKQRLDDLVNVVESEFARGRIKDVDSAKTLHKASILNARRMMSSEQLDAFDVSKAPEAVLKKYGETRFGRGCLAAIQLIEAGVRCVEVTLNGWDSHANNHGVQRGQVDILAPAFAALVADLKARDLLDQTVVLCGGEFGRTPRITPITEGREHWPHGFSVALAGGGIRGGQIVGETDTEIDFDDRKSRTKHVVDPKNVEDIHATVLHTLGIDFEQELQTPVGRPMIVSKGAPIKQLVG
ncbi:MAG: hypothetical protein ACI9HK_001956 [Pirellulaceae bacterium]|jgi:hypothetical protein